MIFVTLVESISPFSSIIDQNAPQKPCESFMSCAAVAPLTYSLSRISLLSVPCPRIAPLLPGEYGGSWLWSAFGLYREPSATMARLALTSVADSMKPWSCGSAAVEMGETGESGETGSVGRGVRYEDDDEGPGIESAYLSCGRAGLDDDEAAASRVVCRVELWWE